MPSVTVIKQYLTQTVIPVLAGAGADWLMTHAHFLAAFHATRSGVANDLTQLGVFAVSAGLAWLGSHHILKGTYAPTPAAGATINVTAAPGDLEAQVAAEVQNILRRMLAS